MRHILTTHSILQHKIHNLDPTVSTRSHLYFHNHTGLAYGSHPNDTMERPRPWVPPIQGYTGPTLPWIHSQTFYAQKEYATDGSFLNSHLHNLNPNSHLGRIHPDQVVKLALVPQPIQLQEF